MGNNIQDITDYIQQLNRAPRSAEMDVDSFEGELKELAVEAKKLGENFCEAFKFYDALGDGNLEYSINKDNPIRGGCMELAANLRHLLWQMERISKGDYTQRIDFMDKVSESFNTMTAQLKEREGLIIKNAKIKEQLGSQRLKALEREVAMQKEHYKNLSRVQEELRGFRHDVKNHIISVLGLMEKEQYDEVVEYLNNITSGLIATGQALVVTGNLMVDALISSKITVAELHGIEFTKKVVLPNPLKISSSELVTLIGNSLDNAIEAASIGNEKGRISFGFEERGNMVSIFVKNTAMIKPVKSDGVFITTKANKKEHGLGIKNMERVVKDYDGSMEANWNNGIFTLTILLLDACEAGTVKKKKKAGKSDSKPTKEIK